MNFEEKQFQFPTFLGNRPVRDIIISNDDIINLRIVLAVTKDVNEFLEVIA